MKPHRNKIQLDIKEVKIGAIQSDSIEEHGTVIALGDNLQVGESSSPVVQRIKVGDTLYFKAWAVDVISKDGEKYYFISADSDAICAIE